MKKNIKKIYLQAIVAVFVYVGLGHVILISSALSQNMIRSYGVPLAYGILGGISFLYIFSHEDFFKFAKVIEKREQKHEKELLRLLKHHGKIWTTMTVGSIGGPIFGALTTRLLLATSKYKYLVVTFSTALWSIMITSLYRGVVLPFLS